MYGNVVNGVIPLAGWERKLYNRLTFLELSTIVPGMSVCLIKQCSNSRQGERENARLVSRFRFLRANRRTGRTTLGTARSLQPGRSETPALRCLRAGKRAGYAGQTNASRATGAHDASLS